MLPPHLAPALKGTFGRDQLIGVKAFFGGAEGSDIAQIRGDGDYHEAGSRTLAGLDRSRPACPTPRTFVLLAHHETS